MTELQTKIVAHHVGGRGMTIALNCPPMFGNDMLHVLYEADQDCIADMRQKAESASNIRIAPYCLGRTDGRGTLHVTANPYFSSLLEPNPYYARYSCEVKYNVTISGVKPMRMVEDIYDTLYGEEMKVVKRQEVEIRSLASLAAEGLFPEDAFPDFLSLDTQGSEYDIMMGGEKIIAENVLGIATEIEFHAMYKGQKLFQDILILLDKLGFHFVGFPYLQEISPYRMPLGFRAGGFLAFGDALFLRRVESLVEIGRNDSRAFILAHKLAFMAVTFGQVEYAYSILRYAATLCPDAETVKALGQMAYFQFLKKLERIPEESPGIFPTTQRKEFRLEAEIGIPPSNNVDLSKISSEENSISGQTQPGKPALPKELEEVLTEYGYGSSVATFVGKRRAAIECFLSPAQMLPPFYFLIVFWGREFRDLFCKFTVASLLAPGNIPAIKNLCASRFLIATTREDWDALQDEPIFQRLQSFIEPVLLELPPDSVRLHKYFRMSLGHKLLTTAAFEAKAIGINLNPDSLFPDGSVVEAQRLAAAGKRVVLCTAIRFDLDGIEKELWARGLLQPGQPLVLSRRDAVGIGLRNLHSESQAGNWDAPNFGTLPPMHGKTDYPICCYWKVPGEEGIIIHTHNWAPFMINYATLKEHNTETFKEWTLDGDYVHRNFHGARLHEDIFVVTDSDCLFLLGMTPREENVTPTHGAWWKTAPFIGAWNKGYLLNQVVFDTKVDELQRAIYPTGVRWHARDFLPNWESVERRQRRLINTYTSFNLAFPLVSWLRFTWNPLFLLRYFWYRLFFHVRWHGPRPTIHSMGGWRSFRLPRFSFRSPNLKLKSLHWARAIYGRLVYGGALAKDYSRVIVKALFGDPVELERIARRMRSIGRLFNRAGR